MQSKEVQGFETSIKYPWTDYEHALVGYRGSTRRQTHPEFYALSHLRNIRSPPFQDKATREPSERVTSRIPKTLPWVNMCSLVIDNGIKQLFALWYQHATLFSSAIQLLVIPRISKPTLRNVHTALARMSRWCFPFPLATAATPISAAIRVSIEIDILSLDNHRLLVR